MISSKNIHLKVKVRKETWEFLKKYCDLTNTSISAFCENAIENKIIKDRNIWNRLSIEMNTEQN